MIAAYKTDVGLLRKNNEDRLYVDNELGLLIVADGMGGHRAGEVASQIAIDTIPSMLKLKAVGTAQIQKQILAALFKANEEILTAGETNPSFKEMGTTVVLALCRGDNIYIAHVGDSRAYIVRQNEIKCLTEDHSIVNNLLKAGKITHEEAVNHHQSHIITQALGSQSNIVPDVNSFTWSKGDYLLLCSDGLTDMVRDNRIKEVILKKGSLQEKVDRPIKMAKAQGGKDNITVILAYRD